MKCPACNKSEMTCERASHHYTESGLDHIYLDDVKRQKCGICGEEFVSIPAVPELHSLIGLELIRKRWLLTGREIRFLRKNMGLSAIELSESMGIDNATISRWENGKQAITPPNDRLIRLIYSQIRNIKHSEIKHMIQNEFKEIKTKQESYHRNIPLKEWYVDESLDSHEI